MPRKAQDRSELLTEINDRIQGLIGERAAHMASVRQIDRDLHSIRVSITKLIGGPVPPPAIGSGRKPKMSAQGRANITAGIRRRWARIRAEKRAAARKKGV